MLDSYLEEGGKLVDILPCRSRSGSRVRKPKEDKKDKDEETADECGKMPNRNPADIDAMLAFIGYEGVTPAASWNNM